MKFQVIVADPPWEFSDTLKGMKYGARGAASRYPVLTRKELWELPIKDLADPAGCVLALWVPSSLLPEGLVAMRAWKFEHKQAYVWVKTTKPPKGGKAERGPAKFLAFGMGRLFRQCHEQAILGVSGMSPYDLLQNRAQRSVSHSPILGHSKKPDTLQDSLELMFPETNKLELFATRQRPGWTCVGFEADGRDVRDAVPSLVGHESDDDVRKARAK